MFPTNHDLDKYNNNYLKKLLNTSFQQRRCHKRRKIRVTHTRNSTISSSIHYKIDRLAIRQHSFLVVHDILSARTREQLQYGLQILRGFALWNSKNTHKNLQYQK